MTAEQKLEFVREIRLQEQKNSVDMHRREQISGLLNEEYGTKDTETYPLRMVLAIALLGAWILCDLSGTKFLGMNTKECMSYIETDYESSIHVFLDAALKWDAVPDFNDSQVR